MITRPIFVSTTMRLADASTSDTPASFAAIRLPSQHGFLNLPTAHSVAGRRGIRRPTPDGRRPSRTAEEGRFPSVRLLALEPGSREPPCELPQNEDSCHRPRHKSTSAESVFPVGSREISPGAFRPNSPRQRSPNGSVGARQRRPGRSRAAPPGGIGPPDRPSARGAQPSAVRIAGSGVRRYIRGASMAGRCRPRRRPGPPPARSGRGGGGRFAGRSPPPVAFGCCSRS